MRTVCHTQLSFANLEFKSVVATFDGDKITSDGGCVLLRDISGRESIKFLNDDPFCQGLAASLTLTRLLRSARGRVLI